MNKSRILLLLLLILAATGVKLLLFPAKNFSSTPQQITAKLQAAVRSRDEKQIAALFANSKAFAEFQDVKSQTLISQVFPYAIQKGPGDSYIDAWNTWFDKNGLDDFDFSKNDNGTIKCIAKDGSFGFVLKKTRSGYLFDDFLYFG